MKKTNLKTPLTIIIYFSFVVISFAQRLDPQQTPYEELRSIVETASRSQQKVWVEDFTGLNWPYCPSASFALDTLLREFPNTLFTTEIHSPSYTPDDSDFDIPSAWETRTELYSVGGIPHTEWNGLLSQVGGSSGGNWESIYPGYSELVQTMAINESPWSIGISGGYEPGQDVNFDIEILIDDIDSTVNTSDLYLEVFVVEDSIYSYWGSVDQWHNARYVLRTYLTKSESNKYPISISNANESELFTGTFSPSDAWVSDNLSIIAFIQRLDGCCEEPVYQVNRSRITDLHPDPDGDGLTYLYDNCTYDYNPDQEDSDGDGLGNVCDGCNGLVNIVGNINLDAEGDDFTPIIGVEDVLAFSDLLENNDLINDCHSIDMLEDGEINQWDLIVLVDLVMAD